MTLLLMMKAGTFGKTCKIWKNTLNKVNITHNPSLKINPTTLRNTIKRDNHLYMLLLLMNKNVHIL